MWPDKEGEISCVCVCSGYGKRAKERARWDSGSSGGSGASSSPGHQGTFSSELWPRRFTHAHPAIARQSESTWEGGVEKREGGFKRWREREGIPRGTQSLVHAVVVPVKDPGYRGQHQQSSSAFLSSSSRLFEHEANLFFN